MIEVSTPAWAQDAHQARIDVLDRLQRSGYDFVSPTPATHRLVAERSAARRGDLRDILGWGRPFLADDLDPGLLEALKTADAVEADGERLRATVRVSTLDGRLHLHSARGGDPQAVFLGPDSYRFVRFLDAVLRTGPSPRRALDVGTGAGAGALAVAARAPEAIVFASDINPRALAYTAANAAHAGLAIETLEGSGVQAASGALDLIIANPPYIADGDGRLYRDGGGLVGAERALRWVEDGLGRLAPGGRFALYTGSPVVEGRHLLRPELEALARSAQASLTWEELDPDIFGGTLRQAAYAEVERIAAIGVVVCL